MINKKLLKEMQSERFSLMGVVACKIVGLFLNVFMVFSIANFVQGLQNQAFNYKPLMLTFLAVIVGQIVISKISALLAYKLSANVKKQLRLKLFQKIYHFGAGFSAIASPAEIVQLSVEGIEQLEMYYSRFMPQFIYSMIAPLLLFIVLLNVNFLTALVLFLLVPLIPVSIMGIQKMAKKTTKKYWNSFIKLSDIFLDLLKGMTTLKVYQADEEKNDELNSISEHFRKNTMRVLAIQLNNITLMDIIAFGGAALGAIISIWQYSLGRLPLSAVLIFILISAEFFLPLRLLGSFFHVAMNGMSASDKLFKILETEEKDLGSNKIDAENIKIDIKNLNFSYDEARPILKNVSMSFPPCGLVAIVGQSGCGKSTVANLLNGNLKDEGRSIYVNDHVDIDKNDINKHFTMVNHSPFIFEGSVKENLQIAKPNASDDDMWAVLTQVKLDEFLKTADGLDTFIKDNAQNLSGGQKQRLAIARALLKDSDVYIFDEASSNIDIESEKAILDVVANLKKSKTVIMITHRLKSAEIADHIYVMDNGEVVDEGAFDELKEKEGAFKAMLNLQQALENWEVSHA